MDAITARSDDGTAGDEKGPNEAKTRVEAAGDEAKVSFDPQSALSDPELPLSAVGNALPLLVHPLACLAIFAMAPPRSGILWSLDMLQSLSILALLWLHLRMRMMVGPESLLQEMVVQHITPNCR
jgi:hypothetical protein